jgi:hypothetical protein
MRFFERKVKGDGNIINTGREEPFYRNNQEQKPS